MYQQQQPKRSGPGIGTAVAAGGAGLLGGVLLTEAFENHEDNEEREAYQDGALRFLDSGPFLFLETALLSPRCAASSFGVWSCRCRVSHDRLLICVL